VRDAKPVGPGELRGSAIDGGQAQQLAPGDVMIVPAGTPHWFRQVEAPLTYYVVKTH
jgi:quercetin dioxygenase-like cupin family protein